MNQQTNLIQWKNLTQEQKADFDFENYKYEYQAIRGIRDVFIESYFYERQRGKRNKVYRLVIEPDKWYRRGFNDMQESAQGKDLLSIDDYLSIGDYSTLRPAKASEIPQPENLEDKIKAKWPSREVRMCKWGEGINSNIWMAQMCPDLDRDIRHCNALSTRGFAGYVYHHEENDWLISCKPVKSWRNSFIQPIAVLFERGEG